MYSTCERTLYYMTPCSVTINLYTRTVKLQIHIKYLLSYKFIFYIFTCERRFTVAVSYISSHLSSYLTWITQHACSMQLIHPLFYFVIIVLFMIIYRIYFKACSFHGMHQPSYLSLFRCVIQSTCFSVMAHEDIILQRLEIMQLQRWPDTSFSFEKKEHVKKHLTHVVCTNTNNHI